MGYMPKYMYAHIYIYTDKLYMKTFKKTMISNVENLFEDPLPTL